MLSISTSLQIPATFGKLYALKELNLNNNRLTGIPNSLSNLNLASFKVAANRLESIPRGILSMNSLEEFQLYGNSLASQVPSIPPSVLNANIQGRSRVEEFQQIILKALFNVEV